MLNAADYFNALFKNTQVNGIVIMDMDGMIKQVNDAFTKAYGYTTQDLQSKFYGVLFTEKDRTLLKPEIELNMTIREGSSTDENYIVHKDGTLLWVTGESVLVKDETHTGIVKIIHNIHAQKQLERYLLASNELLNDLFDSVKSGLLLLDGRLRVIRANSAFLKIFDCSTAVVEGSKIREIPNAFWSEQEVRNDIRTVITKGHALKKEYVVGNDKSNFSKIQITSKLLNSEDNAERRLLLVIKKL